MQTLSASSKSIIVVTGGLGFIGKHFVAHCLSLGHYIINIDVINYAADKIIINDFNKFSNYRHFKKEISCLDFLPECDFIVNFAAESHVDNSIARNEEFCRTNIQGVHRLLDLSKSKGTSGAPLFIQISTDEVYGDIKSGSHSEDDVLRPSNPYSATKAAADMLILGWSRTHNIKYNIIRLSNNYGMHQYPEKLIPKSTSRMLRGLPALLHGDGSYIRSWLHVEDSVSAILKVIFEGQSNTIYNVNGNCEIQNIEVVRLIAKILSIPEELAFCTIPNRVGQDIRYSMDDSKIRKLGWRQTRSFIDELPKIVNSTNIMRFFD